jgi:hypothetical protein
MTSHPRRPAHDCQNNCTGLREGGEDGKLVAHARPFRNHVNRFPRSDRTCPGYDQGNERHRGRRWTPDATGPPPSRAASARSAPHPHTPRAKRLFCDAAFAERSSMILTIERTRPDRVPSLPRRRRCPRDHRIVLGRRLPTLSGWPLVTPAPRPDPGSCRYEASARVYWYSPCRPSPHPWPPDGAGALRLFPELRTRPLLATHVRVGTGLGHGPGATSSAWPNLQST